MNSIKFSKDYHKLPKDCNGNIAYLLFAHSILIEAQTPQLIEYDTRARDGTAYELPKKGQFIILGFIVAGIFFTTIRRFTQDKWQYYNSNVGKEFKIEVKP